MSLNSGIDFLRRSSSELIREYFCGEFLPQSHRDTKVVRLFFNRGARFAGGEIAAILNSSMNLSPRTKLRLLGMLPLIFFLAQGVHYWRRNELGNMLWMCNVGNLL